MTENVGTGIKVNASPEDAAKIKKALADAQTVQSANRDLVEQNSELTARLEQIAQKQFEAECVKYGLDPSDSTPQDLEVEKRVKERERNQEPHEFANVYSEGQQTGKTSYPLDEETPLELQWMEFPTQEALINEVNRRAKKGDVEALKVRAQLTKKMLKAGKLDMEYQGSLRSLMTSPKNISENDSDADKRKKIIFNEKLKRDRTNWKSLE